MTGYPAYRTNQYFMFGQDDIRFNEKLTVNVGLRYEIYTAATAVNNHQANFDLATGDLLNACVTTSFSAGVKTNYGNIEPRLGFAYSLNPKTMIRSAFGITTFSPGSGGQIGTLAENAPWEEGQQLNPATQYTPGPTLDKGLPALVPLQARAGAGPGHYVAIGSHIFWLDPNLRMTKAYQWNLDVQRTLTSKLLLDVAYVGNAVTGLFLNVPGNVPDLEATPSGLSLQERRPYYATNPDLQAFTKRFNGGHSDYHSLQAKLDQRISYGLSFLAAYTYSKTLQRGRDFVDPDNYMQKDVPGQDVKHRLVVSYTYALPFGKGMRYANSSGRLLDAAIGGWQAQGISTFRSGLPFNPTISSQLDNGQGNVPNRVGSGKVSNQTLDHWFDPTAFTQPGDEYGNAGHNFLRGPSYKNWDLSFFKSFKYDGPRYLQFRAEFFNIFNNAQFGNPGTFICNGNCGAGVITSLAPGSNPRQVQFALKLYF